MRSKWLNKDTKFARILNSRFLDYLPCTCKIPGQDHFLALFFIYEPIFNFLWHFLRLLECKSMPISYLYVGVLEQGDMQKGGFQRVVYY